jgi:CheY-like chemotaxis protein
MPRGGRLEITTSNVQMGQNDTSCHDELLPGPYAALSVRDSGCGMDSETIGHIFEPFFTTKERGKGTGLGLATVYGIIKQSGGSIAVDSEPGSGTTFIIYLPQADARPSPLPPQPARAEILRGSETVLLVEDDEMVRGLAQLVLEADRYTVLPARNADEALETARHHAGTIDAVITDMVMPGMGGSNLVEQLRRLRPGLRVVLTSGYAGRGQELIESLGAQAGFLPKPYTPDMLTRILREVLDSSGASIPMSE